jgi:hypothetical protein
MIRGLLRTLAEPDVFAGLHLDTFHSLAVVLPAGNDFARDGLPREIPPYVAGKILNQTALVHRSF